MTVTVLGSAGMFATTERAASGYLLQIDGKNIWLDAGAGTWRNLLETLAYEDLDGVILSHRHPDHTSDVFQAFHARVYGGPESLARIPMWAPGETLEALSSYVVNVSEAFEMNQVTAGEELTIAGARLIFVAMAHPPETNGVRIEINGSVFAYSGDTGPEADFAALAGDADLFICEATLQDSDELWEGHLRASQAGALATEVGARHLVLTHLPPGRDLGLSLAEAEKAAGDVRVQLAADGLRLDVA